MKIVIDLTSLADNFSGFERFALNMAREMVRQDRHNRYILLFKGEVYPDFLRYQEDKRLRMLVLPKRNKLWFYQVTLCRALMRIRADIYFFPAFPSPYFFRKRGIWNTIHDLGCWDCPQTMPWKMVYYFRLMYRNAAKCSERIITISSFSRKRIEKILNVDSNRITVVYCGVSENFYQNDIDSWQPVKEKYQLPDKYLLCLSTLEPRKNLGLLTEAYAELLAEGVQCPPLVLAGRKGWKMEQFLSGIPEEYKYKICTTGFIEEGDLPLLYAHAQWFVFPSLYEGFGIPPLEAMASGCRVVSSDAEAMREVLGEYAVYFKNGDKGSLKQVLGGCLNGDITGRDSSELREYSRRFDYAGSTRKLIRIIEK